MAVVIVGGMISSTVLSLLIVPCMYSYFDDLQTVIGRIARWRPGRRSTDPDAPCSPVASHAAIADEPEREPVGSRER